MQYGIFIFATDRSMSAVDLARAAEDRGFESFWLPEHLHIPVSRETPYPLTPDGSLPEMYFRTLDPFVALAAVASATTSIKLGTGVCLVSEHEPIALAKTVASLDYISGGRFLFGVGAGWLREEMEAVGTTFKSRWQLTSERIEAMKTLWREDEGEHHSEFVEIPKTFVYPKPVQRPHPPIYIGAASRWARQRVVDWADGWIPNHTEPGFIERGMADLRKRAEEAGRDPASIATTVFGAEPEALDEYERMGVERCIFRMPYDGEQAVMAELERYTKVVEARR